MTASSECCAGAKPCQSAVSLDCQHDAATEAGVLTCVCLPCAIADAAAATTAAPVFPAPAAICRDVTVLVLDRPRHAKLIKEIRAAGARIRMISDGDVSVLACAACAVRCVLCAVSHTA
jgi:hypothetical protein